MNGRGGRHFYRGGGGATAISRNIDELTRSFQGQKTDVDELKNMFIKLSTELDQVKSRVRELESTGNCSSNAAGDHQQPPTFSKNHHQSRHNKQQHQQQQIQDVTHHQQQQQQPNNHNNVKPERKVKLRRSSHPSNRNNIKNNLDNQQQQLPANHTSNNNNSRHSSKHQNNSDGAQQNNNNNNNNNHNNEINKNHDQHSQQMSNNAVKNQDLQQSQQSSQEGYNNKNQERSGFRSKKQGKNFFKKPNHRRTSRNYNNNNNNNDGNQQDHANNRQQQQPPREYPELTDVEIDEIVQTLKREFFIEPNNLFKRSLREMKNIFNDKGPKVVFEFVCSILDHTLCDVTSPTKLIKIANRFYLLLIGDEEGSDVDFKQGFFEALTDISKREDDIAIDAPRYMDTLGQLLAECIIPMNKNRYRHLIKVFLNKCLDSYCQKNRAVLLASIMVSIAASSNDRIARAIWDISELQWENIIDDGSDVKEFIESHDVAFTTKEFSPRSSMTDRKDPKELEKFADDVTSLVEKHCTCQTLDDLVKELNLEQDEKIEYFGTLIYAIVRGCLDTNSDDYKLNNETLNKYSSILITKHEEQEAIAMYALTALTKLWHHYNCPQDLLRTILVALHNQGTAPYSALDEWLNSTRLTNIPGIGAARLNCKRYIDDLGANLKNQSSS